MGLCPHWHSIQLVRQGLVVRSVLAAWVPVGSTHFLILLGPLFTNMIDCLQRRTGNPSCRFSVRGVISRNKLPIYCSHKVKWVSLKYCVYYYVVRDLFP